MREGSSKPPRALVWGLTGAIAMRDDQEGRISGGGNSMGKGRAVEKYVPHNASPTIPAQRAPG